jgi:hypothetical protein
MKSNHQIHVRAEFNIEKGKKEEFKKLIQEMSRMVKKITSRHKKLLVLS